MNTLLGNATNTLLGNATNTRLGNATNTLLGSATNTLLGNATNITPLKRRTSRGPGLWMVGGVSFPGINAKDHVLVAFKN